MHRCTALTTTDGNDNKTILSWITFTVGKLSAFCLKKTVFELWAWKASSWVENSHYPDGWREPCLKGCNATVLIEVGIIVFLPGIIVRTHILIHRNLGWGAYCRFYPLHYADARRETSSMGCWSESSCNYAGLSLVNWTFNRSIPYSNSLSFP